MKFNFGHEVLTLPSGVLMQNDADAVQLRVLLWLAADLSLAQKTGQLAKLADCDAKTAANAVKFWQSRGILATEEEALGAIPAMAKPLEAPPKASEKPKKKLLQRADELPTYTSTELAELMESRESVRSLVDEAQQILGKMFNPSEINILVGMLDYLGICEEGILMILAHSKRIGKTNLRSIEKYAYGFVDKGIVEPAALEEEFRTLEALHSFEGEVRTMFGMKSRALTSRESKTLRAWSEYGYGTEIVRLAYELTINATQEPSIPYTNAILERWHAEGLKTLEEIERYNREQREKRAGKSDKSKPVLGNSFDTDDCFEAALQRSFRETGFEGRYSIIRRIPYIWDIIKKIINASVKNTKPRPLRRKPRRMPAVRSFMPQFRRCARWIGVLQDLAYGSWSRHFITGIPSATLPPCVPKTSRFAPRVPSCCVQTAIQPIIPTRNTSVQNAVTRALLALRCAPVCAVA